MKKSKLWLYLFGLLALLFIIIASIPLSRKKAEQIELSFETIEMAEIPGTAHEYPGKEPALVIVTKKEDVTLFGDNVSKQSQSILDSVNFNDYFVITIFQGIKGTTLYGVEIQHIFKKGNVITIYAHFTERDPSIGAGEVMTSPYHIVKIPKQGLIGQMEFILFADDEEIIHQTYTITDPSSSSYPVPDGSTKLVQTIDCSIVGTWVEYINKEAGFSFQYPAESEIFKSVDSNGYTNISLFLKPYCYARDWWGPNQVTISWTFDNPK